MRHRRVAGRGAVCGHPRAQAAITALHQRCPRFAVRADAEHGVAPAAATNPLTENRFAMSRHARRQPGLDNGNPIVSG